MQAGHGEGAVRLQVADQRHALADRLDALDADRKSKDREIMEEKKRNAPTPSDTLDINPIR